MSKDLSYKRVTTTTLNFKGMYHAEDGTVTLPEDGEVRNINDLFEGFDGKFIEGSVKIKVSEDLNENLDTVE